MLITVLAALAAGACFAAGGVLQQHEASTRPEGESLSPRLLLDLMRRPLWLAGIAATAGSFVFKSVALAFGPLTVVQPLVGSELLFAVPVSVRRHKLRLHLREWVGILAVSGGLAVGIWGAQPHRGNPLPPPWRWAELLGGVAVLAGAALLIGRRLTGPLRASSYAVAAVVLLGAQTALLAATVALFRMGLVSALTSWQPYAMAVVSVVALTIVQSAYQAGPLAASMPVMDAAIPVVSILIGIVIFGERIHTGPWHILAAGVGLALLLGGIILVDTSPLVRRVQQIEDQEREEEPSESAAREPARE